MIVRPLAKRRRGRLARPAGNLSGCCVLSVTVPSLSLQCHHRKVASGDHPVVPIRQPRLWSIRGLNAIMP